MSYWSIAAQAHASWPLQDDTETTAIVAESGPAATIAGGKTAAAMTTVGPGAWLPKGLSFDGVNDRLSLASDLPTLAGWSLEAWFRYEQSHSGTLIELRKDNSARLGTGSDGTLVGASNDGSTWHVTKHAATAGVWHHGVVVWDQTSLQLYLDGAAVGAPVATASQNVNYNDPDEIGRAGWGAFLLDGSLAGVRVHPTLAASEVAELYAGPEPTLLALPSLSGPLIVGDNYSVPTGGWDSHSNGPLSYSTKLQSSADGVGGWSDVGGSEGVSSFVVPASLEGAYIRVSATATNDGGESQPVVGEALEVLPATYVFSAVAAGVGQSGLRRAQAVPSAEVIAGQVLHG